MSAPEARRPQRELAPVIHLDRRREYGALAEARLVRTRRRRAPGVALVLGLLAAALIVAAIMSSGGAP